MRQDYSPQLDHFPAVFIEIAIPELDRLSEGRLEHSDRAQ